MIVEALILSSSLIAGICSWAFVQKHRIEAEMQKVKLNHDLEVLRPTPEPRTPPKPEKPNPMLQSLTELLHRRRNLEAHINQLRDRASEYRYSSREYAQFRADALKALSDARDEQKELVLEETGLLKMMQASEGKLVEEPAQKRIETNLDDVLNDLEAPTEEENTVEK